MTATHSIDTSLFANDKLDLLAYLLEEAGFAQAEVQSIARRTSSRHLPLSFAQQRLWFLHQLDPGNTAYNVPAALRLSGRLQIAALEQSLNQVVRRHEILRTTFIKRPSSHDGEPADLVGVPEQVIAPVLKIPLPIVDLEALPVSEREAEVQRLAQSAAQQPFDLAHGPLLRAALLRLSEDEHVLLLTLHHIIADGWSVAVFARELTALYTASATHTPSSLPELPIQYADYAIWQREQIHGDRLSTLLDYWRQHLHPDAKQSLPVLQLPTDRPRPALPSYAGAQQPLRIDRTLTAALQRLSQQHDATLFMTLLAAYATLLQRLSQQPELVIGTPIAGRTVSETEALIGCFLNTLALRLDLRDTPTFAELLAQVRRVTLGAYDHQDLPFEQVVEALQVARTTSHTPVFQVLFILQNTPPPDLTLDGVTLTPLALDSGAAKFDLTLSLTESAAGLSGWIEYRSELFDAVTIERMAAQFQTLLAAIVADPACSIATLPILPVAEQQLLRAWNATGTAYPDASCIHELIAAQATRTPDSVALVYGHTSLTYAELERQANQLAHYLQDLGVGPDVRVGVCLSRSPRLVVALLAILKAGGCYLPLDPAYPTARLQFMLRDSGAPLLLTDRAVRQALADETARVIVLDQLTTQLAQQPTSAPANSVTADHLAYMIYTSGSTGQPKGVMVTHQNVVNFFTGMDDRLGGERPGTWLAVTSMSFDISVLELFWTLARGFEVVLQSEHAGLGAARSDDEQQKAVAFSLFYFANDEGESAQDRYKLLLDGAKFADQHDFAAIWTPERHFHAFGGLYPNPAVTSAAVATITERIQIRAGSVVLPLHHPIRVAEEWSVVDNLSHGRAGISVASGWHADDFVFAPEHYAQRKSVMLDAIETVRKLWRGEAIPFTGGAGNSVAAAIRPRPIQPDLPIWLTAAGNPETFATAGQLGLNLLTHLLGQSIEELADKIALYREAWREQSHPGAGQVTLMLHTFVGDDIAAVREQVRVPFCNYLKTSVGLLTNLARSLGRDIAAQDFSAADMDALLAYAFDRYFSTSALFGTPETCLQLVSRLKAIGVDEIACLIDFGVQSDVVLANLRHLDQLRQRSNPPSKADELSLPEQIRRHQVTHLQCTPSLASMVLAVPEGATALGTLRTLMLGGESLPPSLVAQLAQVMSGEIHNMYGPTETTIWSATHLVDEPGRSVPIGRPIANTELYVLDARLQRVPIGVAGELCIGGDGVTRGYHHRPELTAERFIPNPFAEHASGSRLYKTGDLARYLHDGSLEFLGRLDYQVKLRGFRIELGEIEAALSLHPQIREAVVVARDVAPSAGGNSDVRLVAYIVENKEQTGCPLGEEQQSSLDPQNSGSLFSVLCSTDLRQYVGARLPEYMIPAAYVFVDVLPRTANGKIDRQALPSPDGLSFEARRPFVAPRTQAEAVVAQVLSDVLHLEQVGVYDDFFALGGHSLLAAEVISRLRHTFQVDLPLRSFFEQPTVEGMVQALAQLWGGTEILEEIAATCQELAQLSDEEVVALLDQPLVVQVA